MKAARAVASLVSGLALGGMPVTVLLLDERDDVRVALREASADIPRLNGVSYCMCRAGFNTWLQLTGVLSKRHALGLRDDRRARRRAARGWAVERVLDAVVGVAVVAMSLGGVGGVAVTAKIYATV